MNRPPPAASRAPRGMRPARRVFMMQAAAAASAAFAVHGARAAKPVLSESDPLAVQLGYRADTTKVDKKQFPTHEPSQECGGCQLYDPEPGSTEPFGNCGLIDGKLVAVKGWCRSWA